ncbi:MAG: hypothetical protein P8O79_04390 [Halieaceae bacterium]|nr:hypothetical protein [Halieaceae bacterium]
MSLKFPVKLPYRAMSNDWRRWSKTLASALLVGLPLGLSAQSAEATEELASRDVSEWKSEQSFESRNWSTTLELKARATIKSLATNIAALPSLIAGQMPAATHPLYQQQNLNELVWSASWQQDAQGAGDYTTGFWVELDCSGLLEVTDSQAQVEHGLSSETTTSAKPKQQCPCVLASYPTLVQLSDDAEALRQPVPTAQTWYNNGRVIDPSVYAEQTLS